MGHAHRQRVVARVDIWSLLTTLWASTVLVSVADSRSHPVAKPDFDVYHTKVQVFERLDELVANNPKTLQMENLTHDDGTYGATLTVITVPGADHVPAENKLRLLLNFGEHGRELITVEVALRLLELLADPSRLSELHYFNDKPTQPMQDLLQMSLIKVVPMENVHGRDIVEGGKLCERKNGRGVDPNRNWEVHWGFKEKDYDPNEEYPGKHPFSEPEALLMRRVAESVHPHVWLNVHSGMEALFMPYDHQPRIPSGPEAEATRRMLEDLNEMACKKACATGSGGKSVGYLAHGTATDWMYDVLKVPLALTWEIYGDNAASYDDCFRMFNPLSKQRVDEVVEQWVTSIFQMLELLPSHPAIPSLDTGLLDDPALQKASSSSSSRAESGSDVVPKAPKKFMSGFPHPQLLRSTTGDPEAGVQGAEGGQYERQVKKSLLGTGKGDAALADLVRLHRGRAAWAALQGYEVAMMMILGSIGVLAAGAVYFVRGGNHSSSKKVPRSPLTHDARPDVHVDRSHVA